MPHRRPATRVRSLATATTGEVVRIERILFEGLRALVAGLGLRQGAIVRCRGAGGTHLLLDTPTGRTIALRRRWAQFIQIRRTTDAAPSARRLAVRDARTARF